MPPRLRSALVTAAALPVMSLLVACMQPVAAPDAGADDQAAATATAQPPPPELVRFYEQQLAFGPCAEYATTPSDVESFAAPGLECARLEVPLDYAEPDGETAQIGVLRQVAGSDTDRIGSLLLNPGGPGSSGMGLAAVLGPRLAATPVAQRFDLVGFDPRGVGASTPTINCLTDEDWEAERADLDVDPSPAGVEQTEAENREFVQRCVERSGGEQVLANMGTRDAVRDMDVLRAALGDEKLTYLGYSYGTRLGSAYAEAFPGNVRAMVLDGALDPEQTTIERTVLQNQGFQEAFEAFAADCATQENCPLGTDPAQATTVFQTLIQPLIDQPVPAGDGRELGFNDAITGVTQGLYQSALWPAIAAGISEVATGQGSVLLRLADLYHSRAEDGSYGNAIEAFIAISCVDEQRITDRAVALDLSEQVEQVAPFRATGRGPVGALDPCAFWPAEPTSQPGTPQVDGLPTTLVISVTGDPATPYQAGVDLAAALGGSLLSVDGEQHTAALLGNQCIDDAVTAYLVDLATPPADARCAL